MSSELIERINAEIAHQRQTRGDILDYGTPDPSLVESAATIAQLQAELAEQKERLGKALKLQMDERHKSEAEAKLWFDKAQKWGAELAEARKMKDQLMIAAATTVKGSMDEYKRGHSDASREVSGRIVDWLREEAVKDIGDRRRLHAAKMLTPLMTEGWDTLIQTKTGIATAIEARDWSKP